MSATAKSMFPPLTRLPKSGFGLTATAIPAPFQCHRHVPPAAATSDGLNPGFTESSQCCTGPEVAAASISGKPTPSVSIKTLRTHNETKTDLFIRPPFVGTKRRIHPCVGDLGFGHQSSQRIENSQTLPQKRLVFDDHRRTTLMISHLGTATAGLEPAPQSRLSALFHAPGELRQEEHEQDAPLRFRWNLAASYGEIVRSISGDGQAESASSAKGTGPARP